jgi:hypothetical protein
MIVDKLLQRPSPKPLEIGQLWRVGGGNLQVTMVGKHLVHYQFGKPGAIRVPLTINSISVTEQFLKKNKAVLI